VVSALVQSAPPKKMGVDLMNVRKLHQRPFFWGVGYRVRE
jgi:hypothetical protein